MTYLSLLSDAGLVFGDYTVRVLAHGLRIQAEDQQDDIRVTQALQPLGALRFSDQMRRFAYLPNCKPFATEVAEWLWRTQKMDSQPIDCGPYQGGIALGSYCANDQDFLILNDGYASFAGEVRHCHTPEEVLQFVQDTCEHDDEWVDDYRTPSMVVCGSCGRETPEVAS